MDFFGLINPMLLWGSLAVAAPIIIHLLNRRRFKLVDWAAMDFLLEADQTNRRRIRIENLLLLLLRCLAVLLIALLVSRLFVTPGSAGVLSAAARTERIVLLDDSPSMTARLGNRNAFEAARSAVTRFVRAAADQRPGDTFTLMLTSRPTEPRVNGQYFEQAQPLLDVIEDLQRSERPAELDRALVELANTLKSEAESGEGAANRVVYVVTDLRRRDWRPAPEAESDRTIERLLERVADVSDGLVVVPIDEARTDNLGVVAFGPDEKTVVAGVPVRFEATVRNFGPGPASDVRVTFTAGDAPPMTRTIDRIASGESASAAFTFTFGAPGSTPVRATIDPDVMPADNERRYAARVREGVDVLIVDGDPSVEFGRSESFFLARALSPPGDAASGYKTEVITESQLASVDLDRYQLIVLANVYQVAEARRQALWRWVEQGGGLMLFLGDQVDQTVYNQQFADEGAGLLPARLVQVRGDETERTWARPTEVDDTHPVTSMFAGSGNPLLKRVKVFRWWASDPDAADDPNVRVLARLNDPDRSPLLVERSLGDGRVLMATTSADGDWHDWPSDPSYVVTMLELARYLSRPTAGRGNLATGQTITHPVDVSTYDSQVAVRRPGTDQATTIQAATDRPADGGLIDSPLLTATFDPTDDAGFYEMQLTRHGGGTATVLFAVNVAADEGDLVAADRSQLRQRLDTDKVQLASGPAALNEGVVGGRVELWRTFAIALVVILMLEQTLAWWFGHKRSFGGAG